MKLTKKERNLLIVFLALLYIFVLYNFVLKPNIPKIQDTKALIANTQARLDQLEEDYNNLPSFKQEIEINETTDKWLGEYLMDGASLADSIEFIDSLAKTLDFKFTGISLGTPTEVLDDETKNPVCYAFPINFGIVSTYDELNEIIEFCEGSSKKVKVTGLEIKNLREGSIIHNTADESQEENQNAGNNENAKANADQKLDINMDIAMFSINKENAQGVYNYSRSKFKEYNSYDGTPIFIDEEDSLPDYIEENEHSDDNDLEISQNNADFVLSARGILYAGDNFTTYSRFNPTKRIQMPLSRKLNVELSINNQGYTIKSTDDRGVVNTVSGNVSDKNFSFYIESMIDDNVPEDKDLYIDVKIINDSSHSIYVKVNQTSNRLRLMDRSGNVISVRSEGEKVVKIWLAD